MRRRRCEARGAEDRSLPPRRSRGVRPAPAGSLGTGAGAFSPRLAAGRDLGRISCARGRGRAGRWVSAQNEDEAATDRLLLSVMENLDEDEEVGPARA